MGPRPPNFSDGRDWPKEIEPTYGGYSIGKWVNEDGDGRYDVLEVEPRLQGAPRLLWERASAGGLLLLQCAHSVRSEA
jgi:hypothetical protein